MITQVEGEGGNGIELVLQFIPMLLSYLRKKVRGQGEGTNSEGGNLQLEFTVLSQ